MRAPNISGYLGTRITWTEILGNFGSGIIFAEKISIPIFEYPNYP